MLADRRIAVLLLAVGVIAAETKTERTDCYGDPLPEGAIARMGTVRGRLPDLVEACAFSPDGKFLVAAGGDSAIHLFDAETLRPLRQLQQHKGDVTCLSFSPDGKMLASGSKDGTLCLWDWPSGKLLRQFSAHQEGVRALAFAGTGKFLASGGGDKLIRLWEPATGRELRQFKDHTETVTAIAVSPDGRFVASSDQSFSSSVKLWDAASGRVLHQHKTGVYWVQSLAFSPDSKLVALPVEFLKVGLWDVATGKIVRQLGGKLSGSISEVAFSPDGRSIVAAAGDGYLVLWDRETGKILHERAGSHYFREPGGVTSLSFSPDGRRLLLGEDHCLRVWDLRTWHEVYPVEGHANRIYRLLFSPNNKTLITAAEDTAEQLREWDAATGKKLRTLSDQHLVGRHGFQLSLDHTVLTLVDTKEKSLVVRWLNTAKGKEIRQIKLPFDSEGGYHPAMIVLSPDGKKITSEWREKADFQIRGVLLRDTTTGKVLGKLSSRYDRFLFSPDSNTLACVERKQIDLYNVLTDRIVCKLPFVGEESRVRSMAFSENSRLVAVASSHSFDSSVNPRLDVWETTTGQKRAALPTSRKPPFALALSPVSSLLAAGDADDTIHLWSLASGKEVRQLRGHRGAVDSLAFAHDGKLLASGSWDTTALIWDIREAAEAARPHPTDVPRERLQQLWADLGDNDGGRVHRAIWDLVAARQAMPWLQGHLKPVPPADEQRIARLIADLDSDTFSVREKATQELEAMGEPAEPALRKVLAGKPTLELRRRVEPLLKKLDDWPTSSPAALREWRALEVLEHLGTPEARQLLQKLSDGVPEARLTHEAKVALQRLDARRDNKR